MVDIAICRLSNEGTREDNVYENIARDALHFLRDEHGINVLDYNWFLAEELRLRCIPMVKNLIESESIYEFVHTKCFMVLDGIDFASTLFMNKVYEVENELKKGHVQYGNCFKSLHLRSQKYRPVINSRIALTLWFIPCYKRE